MLNRTCSRAITGLLVVLFSTNLFSTPTYYSSYKREQLVNYTPKESDIMRIWMIDVGQGDGMLIQLPHKEGDDPTDILIDGGAFSKADVDNAKNFVKNLYARKGTIEHSFITHHDSDHVKGLIDILKDTEIAVNKIYHNGLASYIPRKKEDPIKYSSREYVFTTNSSGTVSRVMASFDKTTKELDSSYIINSISELKTAQEKGHLHNIYDKLAAAVVNKTMPAKVESFERFSSNSIVNLENEDVQLTPLWPVDLKRYKSWSYTINGNSLTFRLQYKDFSMLFTGDHNDESQSALLEHLEATGRLHLLDSDVLKIPHHGSSHGEEDFFRNDAMNAVVGVASMGEKGFGYSWKHPNTKIVRWMGGAHKVFHTYAEEKYINWYGDETIKKEDFKERSHILIETDGVWFRVVEIEPGKESGPIPIVQDVRAGDGTQWVKAKPQ